MCGIIGEIIQVPNDTKFASRQKNLFHRGPDSSGYAEFSEGRVRFGHQRLSIIDLSERGGQPMIIGGYAIIYNGEVYNFKELRDFIGAEFSSESDTEVILRGYIKFGIDIFSKLDGMFALAIYDPKENVVVLSRDRFGIKPLFYSKEGKNLSFASELNSVKSDKALSQSAVASFLFQGYVMGRESVYRGVYSLRPGTYAVWDIDSGILNEEAYFEDRYEREDMSFNDAIDNLDVELKSSVAKSLVSDAPVGVYLSGGIDSPLIGAYATLARGPLKSFSIGFEDKRFDESHSAEKIALHLGLKHQTYMLSDQEIIDSIPKILDSVGEPLGDSSVIPTYFLSKFARKEVKVCLSGDGADELFGGYPLYYLPKFARLYRNFPARNLIDAYINNLKPSYGKMDRAFKLKQFIHGSGYVDPLEAHLSYRGLRKLESTNFEILNKVRESIDGWPIAEKLMYLDRQTILPNDYLLKVDRMSMAHSLEVRVPFLNNEVVNLANKMPAEYKLRGIKTKLILRKLLSRYLPKDLISRSKMGFSFPISNWLRNQLKEYMLSVLSHNNVEKIPGLDYGFVESIIRDHIEGREDNGRELWSLISLVSFASNSHAK